MMATHGALGLAAGLPTLLDLVGQSASEKRVLVELRPGRVVEGWSAYSGATYVAALQETFDGVNLDVVAVQTLLDSGLTRAEDLVSCVAAAGTFFYDPDITTGPARWDDGVTHWDDGVTTWDQFPFLYVHLFNDANPAITTVVAFFLLTFGTVGSVQPNLGADKLTNGGFESWASSTDANNWTETPGAAITVNQETTIVYRGTSVLRFTATAAANGDSATERQDATTVSGMLYRLSFAYQTDPGNPQGLDLRVRVHNQADGTANLQADGRSFAASPVSLPLPPTGGEWKRAVFDFRAQWTTTRLIFSLENNTGSAATGRAYVDDVSIRRVWRYNYYEPRVSAAPGSESGANDVFFGGDRIGQGAIRLIDADALLEPLLADLDILYKEGRTYSGGAIEDGSEVPFEESRRGFTGLVQDLGTSNKEATLDLQDLRAFFHRDLPERVNNDADSPGLDPNIRGKSRPLLFGQKANITPYRISKAGDYGVYEIADCLKSPAGIKAIDAVYSYADSDAAGLLDTTRRLTLSAGTDYSADLANGQFTVLRDVQLIEITTEETRLDFNDGSVRAAILTPGFYVPASLAAHVQTQMRAVGAGDLNCTHADGTHKITISKGAGSLSLLIKSGTNAAISAWKKLGFDPSADKSGSLSYVADSVIFTDADKQHLLRIDAQGYKDDAAGTYTGSANALVVLGPDLIRLLTVRWLGKALSALDATTFASARTVCPEPMAFLLKDPTSTKAIFDTIALTNLAKITIDGTGTIFYDPLVDALPASAPALIDNDWLADTFEMGLAVTDLYTTVIVTYDEDPTLGTKPTRTLTDESVALRYGRAETRTFNTYLKNLGDAITLTSRLLALAKTPGRTINGSVKIRLLDARTGQKARVTKRRGLDATGALTAVAFRILSQANSYRDGVSAVSLVEDRAIGR